MKTIWKNRIGMFSDWKSAPRAYFANARPRTEKPSKDFLDVLHGVDKHLSYFSVPLSKTFHIHFPDEFTCLPAVPELGKKWIRNKSRMRNDRIRRKAIFFIIHAVRPCTSFIDLFSKRNRQMNTKFPNCYCVFEWNETRKKIPLSLFKAVQGYRSYTSESVYCKTSRNAERALVCENWNTHKNGNGNIVYTCTWALHPFCWSFSSLKRARNNLLRDYRAFVRYLRWGIYL